MEPNEVSINETLEKIDMTITIIKNNNKPAIIIRKIIVDPRMMRYMINTAINDKEIIVRPTFKNKIYALNQLLSKGIIYKEKEKYFYTI